MSLSRTLRKVLGLGLVVLAACDDAVVGRLSPDGSVAPLCDFASAENGAASGAPVLAYGGASAGDEQIVEGRVNRGRKFEVVEDCVVVVELGVWDHNQDGLSRAHAVTLFALDRAGAGARATPVPGGDALVFAGSDVPLVDGFRLATLAAPLPLPRGVYAVVAYDFSSEEPYGVGGTVPAEGGAVRDLGFDPFEASTNASPAYPSGDGDSSHSSASFRYFLAAP